MWYNLVGYYQQRLFHSMKTIVRNNFEKRESPQKHIDFTYKLKDIDFKYFKPENVEFATTNSSLDYNELEKYSKAKIFSESKFSNYYKALLS